MYSGELVVNPASCMADVLVNNCTRLLAPYEGMMVLGPTNNPTLKELTAGAVGDTVTVMSMMLDSARGGVTAMVLLYSFVVTSASRPSSVNTLFSTLITAPSDMVSVICSYMTTLKSDRSNHCAFVCSGMRVGSAKSDTG